MEAELATGLRKSPVRDTKSHIALIIEGYPGKGDPKKEDMNQSRKELWQARQEVTAIEMAGRHIAKPEKAACFHRASPILVRRTEVSM